MDPLIQSLHSSTEITPSVFESLIEAALSANARSLFILVCDSSNIDYEAITLILHKCPAPVFGGVFPALIVNQQSWNEGMVVAGLSEELAIQTLADVEKIATLSEHDFKLPPELNKTHSMLALVDGLSHNIDGLIARLYDHIGPGCSVIGGGAGSLSFEQRPCILSNQGVLQDCLQLIALARPMTTTTRHGWQTLAGPFLVTDSQDHTIRALNFRPVYDVYRETVEQYSSLRFEDQEFFKIAKTFPFGLERLDIEPLVRDPILANEGMLTCVGNVPENAMAYVLHGEETGLIGAVAEAAAELGSSNPNTTDVLVFDCISRQLFLDLTFRDELGAICQPFSPATQILGALSLGEIANCKSGQIELHNKTAVLGAL